MTGDELLLRMYAPVLLADDGDRFLGDTGSVTVHASKVGPWLSYWICYASDPDHEGDDWEHVMVLLDDQVTPTHAVYAQHRGAETRRWERVTRIAGHPVVRVGRHKHASYYDGRWHRHGLHPERTNAKRQLRVLLVLDVPAAVRKRQAQTDPDAWVLSKLRRRRGGAVW